MSSAPATPGLIFQWPLRRIFANALPLFVAASLLVHAAGFALFQIVYPAATPMIAPPPDVRLLAPDAENGAFLAQVEADDPARSLGPPPLPAPPLRHAEYAPSYANVRTVPRMVPAAEPPIGALPILDPGALVEAALPRTPLPSPGEIVSQTRIEMTGALRERIPADVSAIVFNRPAILQPPTFLLGVDQEGRVTYIFRQSTSGDDATDKAIEAQLKKLNFAPGSTPLTWGMASWIWGTSDTPANP
jgi:hypothetical protein